MKTSSFIAAAATILIALGLWGGDLVRAFPGDAGPEMSAAADAPATRAAYQWRGYWDRDAADPAATRACPARRSLSLSWEGPRLSWQRSCAHAG